MKTNTDVMLRQVEKFVEEHGLSMSARNRHDELLLEFPLSSDDNTFFLITVCFNEEEVIGAISTPIDPKSYLHHMADEDFRLEYVYIYPICGRGIMWNDMDYPLMHLLAKANELYN